MYRPYTLDQLVTLVAVVEAGSFSAAGRRLGRVQSAVSYAISQLEEALGTTLFDRRGHRPVLTAAGERLVAEARLVLAQARELSECAARLQEGVEAELRVAVDAIYPRDRLLDACAALQARFPATVLRLSTGILADVVAEVRSGRAELGLGNLAGRDAPDVEARWLGVVRLVPVCAADHPLASAAAPLPASALRRHTQIVHTERPRVDPEGRADGTEDQGVLAARTWRVTDLDTKVALIRRGIGWGSLPEDLAARGVADGALVRLQPAPWPVGGHRLSLHALTRPDAPLGPAGLWLRDALHLADGP